MSLAPPRVDAEQLRDAICAEYAEVAETPDKGFHFHTGRRLAELLGYAPDVYAQVPPENLASFAGVGRPFVFGALRPGERVVEVGSGAGFDSLVAGRMVGPEGRVVGVDMTPAMLEKARLGAQSARMPWVEYRAGLAEALPVADGWADVVISNGVINLCPDKGAVWREICRVLAPGGRVQIADIVVERPVPEDAKGDIDLWTG
jgi:arsenite methyltransferase